MPTSAPSSNRITELRLTAFKSFRDAVVPLEPLTVLIGRNGSGKSNALDALEMLSRLARGDDVRDAIEGNRRDADQIRGGLDGCAPHGSDTFELGVSLSLADGSEIRLDITAQVRPQVQIVAERLCHTVSGRIRTLVETADHDPNRADIGAAVWNGKQGPNPRRTFRSTHLVTSQLALRLEGKTQSEQYLVKTAAETLALLGGVFHLDPVPHLMRGYVAEQDVVLRRTAENLSASVAHLKHTDAGRFAALMAVVKTLPEYEVRSLDIAKGGFGEVMLALRERSGRQSVAVPARQMSDGMLRMLAIATALITGGGGLAIAAGAREREGALMLVIEELENGLHPSQAAALLALITQQSAELDYQVVLTTHSPALLDALPAERHRGVVVVQRQRTSGVSTAQRLTSLPGYVRALSGAPLGELATTGSLPQAEAAQPDSEVAELSRLLGIA